MDYMKLPIDQVELDLENPRIKQWLEIYGEDTEPKTRQVDQATSELGRKEGGESLCLPHILL